LRLYHRLLGTQKSPVTQWANIFEVERAQQTSLIKNNCI
jgi:hypothetical protein